MNVKKVQLRAGGGVCVCGNNAFCCSFPHHNSFWVVQVHWSKSSWYFRIDFGVFCFLWVKACWQEALGHQGAKRICSVWITSSVDSCSSISLLTMYKQIFHSLRTWQIWVDFQKYGKSSFKILIQATQYIVPKLHSRRQF